MPYSLACKVLVLTFARPIRRFIPLSGVFVSRHSADLHCKWCTSYWCRAKHIKVVGELMLMPHTPLVTIEVAGAYMCIVPGLLLVLAKSWWPVDISTW